MDFEQLKTIAANLFRDLDQSRVALLTAAKESTCDVTQRITSSMVHLTFGEYKRPLIYLLDEERQTMTNPLLAGTNRLYRGSNRDFTKGNPVGTPYSLGNGLFGAIAGGDRYATAFYYIIPNIFSTPETERFLFFLDVRKEDDTSIAQPPISHLAAAIARKEYHHPKFKMLIPSFEQFLEWAKDNPLVVETLLAELEYSSIEELYQHINEQEVYDGIVPWSSGNVHLDPLRMPLYFTEDRETLEANVQKAQATRRTWKQLHQAAQELEIIRRE
jgi:hypothetical protein